MPLGNGRVALNAWIEADGSLLFYIARSDAWDEYGRLLKLGKVRVQFDPVPDTKVNFRQRLRLRDAVMVAGWGEGQDSVAVSLWVDAAAPVIHVEAETGLPNPIYNQPGWHGAEGIDYFTSSQQAYDMLHIGDPGEAARLQAEARK